MRNEWYEDADAPNDVYRITYGKISYKEGSEKWCVATSRFDGKAWDTLTRQILKSERIFRVSLEATREEFRMMGLRLLPKRPYDIP